MLLDKFLCLSPIEPDAFSQLRSFGKNVKVSKVGISGGRRKCINEDL